MPRKPRSKPKKLPALRIKRGKRNWFMFAGVKFWVSEECVLTWDGPKGTRVLRGPKVEREVG